MGTTMSRMNRIDDPAHRWREDYRREGYVIVPDALTPRQVELLRAEMLQICRGARGHVLGVTPRPSDEPDEVTIRKYAAIHGPHKISPLIHQALAYPTIVDVLTQVIGPDVKAMQSMIFTKGEGKPGQAWHQDEYFIPSRDHYMSASSLLPWREMPEGMHVAKWDYREIVMVAGTDPYA